MSEIVNCTPHDVHLCDDEGNVIRTFPASGTEFRVDEKFSPMPLTSERFGFPVSMRQRAKVDASILPKYDIDRLIIVSRLFVEACIAQGIPTSEMVFPIDLVRDDAGKVVGCKGFGKL